MSRKDRFGFSPLVDDGTEMATVAYSPPMVSEEGAMNRARLEIEEMVGHRGSTQSEYGLRSFSIPVNGALRPKSGGLFLANHFGPPVSSQPDASGAATVYRHVFNPLAHDYPVRTTMWGVNKDRMLALDGTVQPPICIKYIGAVGNTIQLACELNNYLLMESTSLALDADPDATEPAMTQDLSGKWPFNQLTATISIAGGSYVDVPLRSFQFNNDNNLVDDEGRLGALSLDDIPIENLDTTLQIVARRDIPGHFKRAFKDTPEQVGIKITAAGPIITTVAGTPPTVYRQQLEISLPYLETVSAPVGRSGSDTLRNVTVTFNATTDPVSGKQVELVLQNTETGTLYVEQAA